MVTTEKSGGALSVKNAVKRFTQPNGEEITALNGVNLERLGIIRILYRPVGLRKIHPVKAYSRA